LDPVEENKFNIFRHIRSLHLEAKPSGVEMCTSIGLIAFREKQIHASNKTVLLVFLFFVIVLPLVVSTSYSWRVTYSLSIGTKAVVIYDFIQPIKRPKTFIIL
jgi:hypothetical protein